MTYQSAFEIVQRLVRENRPTAVCPSNTHILSEARHDPECARVMSNFDLIFPDGMPVVWAMNLRGAGLSDRVYGPYFMKYLLERTPRPWLPSRLPNAKLFKGVLLWRVHPPSLPTIS